MLADLIRFLLGRHKQRKGEKIRADIADGHIHNIAILRFADGSMVRRFNFPAQQLMLGGFDRFLADRSRQRAGKGDGGLPAKIGQTIDGVFLASRAVLTGEMADSARSLNALANSK